MEDFRKAIVENTERTSEKFVYQDKQFEKDKVTLDDGVTYIYNRLATFKPLAPGQAIQFEERVDKQGNKKMNRVKLMDAGSTPQPKSNDRGSSVASAALDYKKQLHTVRGMALDVVTSTFKFKTVEEIIEKAQVIEGYILGKSNTPPPEVNSAPPAPETKQDDNDGGNDDDDLPF